MVSRRRSRRGRPYGWRQWLLSALIIVSTTPVAWALWHLAADTGAKLKDLMVRAGQSSERAQLIYQHSTVKHQRRLARGSTLKCASACVRRVPIGPEAN